LAYFCFSVFVSFYFIIYSFFVPYPHPAAVQCCIIASWELHIT
jgi:hypothetical protein